VLRLDQAAAEDLSWNQSGLTALIGTNILGVTRQTFYSAPAYNIAQANVFNYMGLQTDGRQDVYKATEDYFRSIAYGQNENWGNTEFGNTRTSEAGRIRYWMTDGNSPTGIGNGEAGQISPKGPEFNRRIYQGKSLQSESPYPNEISIYGSNVGLYYAHDYVLYNFGNRSNRCDGTSRGYYWNLNKSSWVELVPAENNEVEYRGMKAYDVPWANNNYAFIYDGLGMGSHPDGSGRDWISPANYYSPQGGQYGPGGRGNNGSGSKIEGGAEGPMIGAVGFSVNRSYNNYDRKTFSGGISQFEIGDQVKGWQGTGMVDVTQTVFAYDLQFDTPYSNTTNTVLRDYQLNMEFPKLRDWNDAQHDNPYIATRPLLTDIYGTTSWRGIENGADRGDKSPRSTINNTFTASGYNNKGNDRRVGIYANQISNQQNYDFKYTGWTKDTGTVHVNSPDNTSYLANPYNFAVMLEAYVIVDSPARQSEEFKLMREKRYEMVQATVIADSLIFELPENMTQSLLYFYKNASALTVVGDRIPDIRITFEELWTESEFTPYLWQSDRTRTAGTTSKDAMPVGGYNGEIGAAVTGQDVQTRLRMRSDEALNSKLSGRGSDDFSESPIRRTYSTAVQMAKNMFGNETGVDTVTFMQNNPIFAGHASRFNDYFIDSGTPTVQVLSRLLDNQTTSLPINRTLLYNISPILLTAQNR
jgi:hypothetical protein